jgi:hypothetical protein
MIFHLPRAPETKPANHVTIPYRDADSGIAGLVTSCHPADSAGVWLKKAGPGTMARIPGIDLDGDVQQPVRATLEAQERRWGAPLLNHLIYARRPTIFRGVRAMWTGIGGSGLVDERLQALVNIRVAALNGCLF